MRRIGLATFRVLAVAGAFVLAAPFARSEDAAPDLSKDLRLIAKKSAPLDQRLAAVKRVLAAGRTGDVDGAVRAAANLLGDAPLDAARVLKVARDEDVVSEPVLAEFLAMSCARIRGLVTRWPALLAGQLQGVHTVHMTGTGNPRTNGQILPLYSLRR